MDVAVACERVARRAADRSDATTNALGAGVVAAAPQATAPISGGGAAALRALVGMQTADAVIWGCVLIVVILGLGAC